MEHRAVGICPGFDEVEPEGRGESREQREPVSQCHWLEHEPVFVDQAEPAERLREGGTSPTRSGLSRFAFEGADLVGLWGARSLRACELQR
jgi:hypothetical protein